MEKKYRKLIFISLGLLMIITGSIICGYIHINYGTIKSHINEKGSNLSINKICDKNVKVNVFNEDGDYFNSIKDLHIKDNEAEININISNYLKNKELKYKVMVLVNSKQVDFYDTDNTIATDREYTFQVEDENNIKLKLKDINVNINEVTVVLVCNKNSKYNYCFNISNGGKVESNFEMEPIKVTNLNDGIYLNSTEDSTTVNESNILFNKGKESIDIPIIFKNDASQRFYKLYLFNELNKQVLINNKTFLCVNKDSNVDKGVITIEKPEEDEGRYVMLAVACDEKSNEEYFSQYLTIVNK